MSKKKLIAAILIAVFILCLSACGESKNTDETASPSDTESSSTQIQKPTSGTGSSLTDSSETRSESSIGTDPNDTESIEDNGSRSNGDTSVQDSADRVPSPENDDSGSDNRNDDNKATEPEVVLPTVKVSPAPQEIDNAEVDFNDL